MIFLLKISCNILLWHKPFSTMHALHHWLKPCRRLLQLVKLHRFSSQKSSESVFGVLLSAKLGSPGWRSPTSGGKSSAFKFSNKLWTSSSWQETEVVEHSAAASSTFFDFATILWSSTTADTWSGKCTSGRTSSSSSSAFTGPLSEWFPQLLASVV